MQKKPNRLSSSVSSVGITNKLRMYPDYIEIRSLHKKLAPDEKSFDLIFTHSVIVCEIACTLIKNNKLDIDVELVEAGALLHDIGTYSLYQHGSFDKENYITHGIRGYEILKNENYPEQLCRIASNHTGTGITRQMIKELNLPMPENDYVANTVEERLVMYADKFHSKTPKFNTYDSYHKFSEQFGGKVTQRFEAMVNEFGLPDLEFFSKEYGHPIA